MSAAATNYTTGNGESPTATDVAAAHAPRGRSHRRNRLWAVIHL